MTRVSINFKSEILKWLDEQVSGNKNFSSRSHAVNYCCAKIMQALSKHRESELPTANAVR